MSDKKEAAGSATEAPAKPQEKFKKEEHSNIFAALSAFQGENPKIERTKKVEFEAKGAKVEFWYSPLDEVLQVVRPLLAKHGLAITWEEGKEKGTMVAALYHETYKKTPQPFKKTGFSKNDETPDGFIAKTEEVSTLEEDNVIRSMPIKVARTGGMKEIGSDSTYARRYTLAEVLAIAPDEDNDVAAESERMEKVEGFAFKQAMTRVQSASDKQLTEQMNFFDKELKAILEAKPTSLGFKKEQYEQLQEAGAKRRSQLAKEVIIPPGENATGSDN